MFDAIWGEVGHATTLQQPTADHLMEMAGVKGEVEKRALYFKDEEDVRVPGMYAIVRPEDHKVYTVVGENYIPIKHRESIEYFLKIIHKIGGRTVASGTLREGQFVWVMASTPYTVQVGDDKLTGCLLFTIPHLLGTAMNVQLLAVRDKSGAAFPLPLLSDARGSHRLVILASEEALEKESKRISKAVQSRLARFKKMVQQAAKTCPSNMDTVRMYFYKTLRLPMAEDDQPWKEHKLVRLAIDNLSSAPGHTTTTSKQSSRPTWWNVLCSLAYLLDFQAASSADNRVFNSWYGPASDVKRRAISALTNQLMPGTNQAEEDESA